MARRITLTVIALMVVLLGIVAVPLGQHVAREDKSEFLQQTTSAAAAAGTVAEEQIDDGTSRAPLAQLVADLRRHGDQVAVYERASYSTAEGFGGSPAPRRASAVTVAGSESIGGVSAGLVEKALNGATLTSYPSADRILIVTPVYRDESKASIGAVALSRSTEPLDHRITALWTWLLMASAGGLLAAALAATALARWVSGPLSGLEAAARRLGAGELSARSPAETGPREVRRLAGNFNMMAGRLDALVTGHRAMMADVSHQLRTPLAALRLRLDVLALAAPKPLADELAGAQGEVARLSRMVDGLLAVARAENVITSPVSVPVNALIRDRVLAWLPAAEEKPVTLEAAIGEPLTARLGEGHLEQILDNLLANALEAVPAGGHIRVGASQVSAGQVGGLVRVVVADDGPGMSVQERRAALRRYVTATPGGTGLGLAIVHRLVTSGGGTIDLSETPGGGLTVTIDVPAAVRERPGRRG